MQALFYMQVGAGPENLRRLPDLPSFAISTGLSTDFAGSPGNGASPAEKLRPRMQVTRVDPNSLMPQWGVLEEFYAGDGRKIPHGRDGLVLLGQHEITKPVGIVAQDYGERRVRSDWSPETFHGDHFIRPPVTLAEFRPPTGITLEEYTRAARRFLTVPAELQPNGLTIQLPHTVTAAGNDRFYPFWYAWDAGTQNYGLKAAGEIGQIENNALNAEYLIDLLGEEPNANTRFQSTRGQMPYLVDAITLMYERFGEKVILRYLDTVETQWRTKMDGMEELSQLEYDGEAHARKRVVRMPDGTYLNRYHDSAGGPRQEMMSEDIEFAERAVEVQNLNGQAAEDEKNRIFNEIRVVAASGRDFSVEHFADPRRPETICASEVVPVDLNSKMYHMEQFLALGYALKAAKSFGLQQQKYLELSHYYEAFAEGRRDSMEVNLRDPQTGMLRNKNVRTGQFMPIISASMGWAWMYGDPSVEATFGIADGVEEHLLAPGGIGATNAFWSDQQWDGDLSWGNNNLAAALGAARMHHRLKERSRELRERGPRYDPDRLLALGESVKEGYTTGNQIVFDQTGRIKEKFPGRNPAQQGRWGEYRTVDVFGMSNEVNAALNEVDLTNSEGVIWLDPIASIRKDLQLPANSSISPDQSLHPSHL